MALDDIVFESEAGDSSLSGHEPEDGEDDVELDEMAPPLHPVPSMQAAFEESIHESTDETDRSRSPEPKDAPGRRQKLLEMKQYDDSWTSRWHQKATAQHHPLMKLLAQIVFGMHLLQQQQAKSEEEVVKILQNHVNEVDTFLERTSEDFDLAIRDIEDRIRYLKLPMTHIDVFEVMLEDKKFRSQLLDGNEKIEKIIDRTTRAMNAALLDVQKGIKANKELGKYLNDVHEKWPKHKRGIFEVYEAMRGNEQGWKSYLKELQTKGHRLGEILGQLSGVISQMSQMAATASRRNKDQNMATSKSAPSSPGLRSKLTNEALPRMPSSPRGSDLNKPLPSEPKANGKTQVSVTKLHSVPFAEKWERPRESPRSPGLNRPAARSNEMPPRPKTAGGGKPQARAADARQDTRDLAEFFKGSDPVRNNPNPLRSNPPQTMPRSVSDNLRVERKPARSASQGANIMLSSAAESSARPGMERSKSQDAIGVLGAPDTSSRQSSQTQRSSSDEWRTHNTGFARRLSKRMKHIPVPEDGPIALQNAIASKEPYASHPDSAYSSGTDKNSPSGGSKKNKQDRPESTLGPLPFQGAPFRKDTPIQRTVVYEHGSSPPRAPKGAPAPSVKSLASTSKSRTLSMKSLGNMFSRRWKVTA